MFSFYEAPDLLQSLSALLRKMLSSNQNCIIFTSDASLDEKLWTASQLDFIPHANIANKKFSNFIKNIPVLISDKFIEPQDRVVVYYNAYDIIDPHYINRQIYLFSEEHSPLYQELYKKTNESKEFYRKHNNKWEKVENLI